MRYSHFIEGIYTPKTSQLYKVCAIVFLLFDIVYAADAIGYTPTLRFSTDDTMPFVLDSNLKVEEVVQGLELPTTMAFRNEHDILVLEKDKGTVQRIVNGQIINEPAIDVNVATEVERCMCGIAISTNKNDSQNVFLYYTEAESTDGGKAIGNRVYRYEILNGTLANEQLILDLPAFPGPRHNGGSFFLGPEKKRLFFPLGGVGGSVNSHRL